MSMLMTRATGWSLQIRAAGPNFPKLMAVARIVEPAERSAPTCSWAVQTNPYQAWMTVTDHKIVAFGLLTERDLQALGPSFSRVWPVDEKPCFTQLLHAIDEADSALQPEGSGQEKPAFRSVGSRHNPIGEGRR